MKEKLPGMSVTKQGVTKLGGPVILVVVRSSDNQVKDIRCGPGRVTLWVAARSLASSHLVSLSPEAPSPPQQRHTLLNGQ